MTKKIIIRKIFKILKRLFIAILTIVSVLVIIILLYMRKSKFGKNPTGERLELISSSPNYKNGQFQNLSTTPVLAENYTMIGMMYDKLFKKFPNLTPIDNMPNVKTNLHDLDINENVLIWFGHSSYYIQLDGIRILVDPVFSGNASPIPNTVKSFKGSNIYTAEDIPKIDFLLISHDHYDHLDYETMIALRGKIENVICGLGVGAHLEHWGYNTQKIIEKDWHDSVEVKKDFTVFVKPARHFSGRGFTRNKTLWVSFVLKSPSLNLYLGGDSGYDTHYADIGNQYGPFDLVILENGQYNKAWPHIHETPDELLKAAQDLKAKRIFPVHSGKFALSSHPWDEPLKKLTKLNENYHFPLVTPIIGEIVYLENTDQSFDQWWSELE